MHSRKTGAPLGALLAFAGVVGVADLLGHSPYFGGLAALTLFAFLAAKTLSARAWRCVLGAMLALSVLAFLVAASQIGHLTRPKGPFVSPNFLAYYAALHVFIGVLLRARARRPYLCDAVIAANGVALLLSQSLGGVLALGIGGLFLVPPKYQRRLPELLCLVSLLFVLMAHVTPGRPALYDDPRPTIWLYGLHMAKWHLLLGYGQRDFFVPPQFAHFYSSAIACLVAAGVVGLGVGVWMIGGALRAAWRWPDAKESRALRGFLAAWIVNGLFIYDTPESVIPLYVVLAFVSSLVNRDVADGAALVDHGQPLVYDAPGAERAGRADRGHGDGAVGDEATT